MRSGINSCLAYLLIVSIFLGIFSFSFSQNNEITDTSYFVSWDDDFNLIMAADRGDSVSVRMLLKRGADINTTTIDGVTPLMYAAQNGMFSMVKLLADSGADLNKVPFNGVTALIVSAQQNFYEIAEYLVEKGANLDVRDEYGVTPTHYAAAYNHFDIMDMLIFYGADVELPDLKGNTPLISASFNNCLEAVDLLILNGANVNSADNYGNTALMVSIWEENKDITNLLIEKGADINLVNKYGLSALAIAVAKANLPLIEQLVQNGADVNQRNTSEGSILDIAKNRGNVKVISFLESKGAKASKSFRFNQAELGLNFDFNGTDYMNGFTLGAIDSKYNLVIISGFDFRPVANRVLAEFSNITYQFWERRYSFYLGLEKRFKVIRTSNYLQSGPILGVRELLTYGGYRGSTMKPDTRLITSPLAGWYLQVKGFSIRFDYHYLNFKTPEIKPGRFSLTLLLNSGWQQQKLMINKKRIDWLQ